MLVGHLAVGLSIKRVEPKISLGTLIAAAMFADLLWPIFMLAGIEQVGILPGVKLNRMIGYDIAYSHSLLMDAIYAALFAAVYFVWRRYSRGAWMLLIAVLSHWLLDVVSHRPDMPIAPGVHTVFGLGLWNSIPATILVEGGFWLLAIITYVRATYPKGRAGTYGFWSAIALLTVVGAGNLVAPPPSDPVRAGIGSLTFFLLIVAWAYWMEHVRGAGNLPRQTG